LSKSILENLPSSPLKAGSFLTWSATVWSDSVRRSFSACWSIAVLPISCVSARVSRPYWRASSGVMRRRACAGAQLLLEVLRHQLLVADLGQIGVADGAEGVGYAPDGEAQDQHGQENLCHPAGGAASQGVEHGMRFRDVLSWPVFRGDP
jgi:hypothetical protein